MVEWKHYGEYIFIEFGIFTDFTVHCIWSYLLSFKVSILLVD